MTHLPPITWTPDRRMPRWAIGAMLLGLVTLAATAVPASAVDADGPAHLVVADAAESVVYVYSIPELTLTGQLDDTRLGLHNGVLTLADGRLLFTDDATGALKIVSIDDAGVPTVEGQVAVWQGSRIVWSSVDSSERYLIAAGEIPDSELQVLNIVDLETLANTPVQLPMGAAEEILAWLGDDGETVVVSQGGSVATYDLDDMLDGNSVTALGSVAIALGSHGAAADPTGDRFLVSTAPGLEVVDIADGAPVHVAMIPWDVDGLTGGQNFRPRLAADGQHVIGVLTAPTETPEAWATAEVSVHTVDLGTLEASRVPLGAGRFAGRWGISEPYALFAGTDGVTGAAHLFDVDPASATYGTVVATVPLDLPSDGAVPGSPTVGTEGYLTAITPDGSLGFVVHGGDGRISVIDTAAGTVTDTIEVPTSLAGAGFAAVVEPGVAPVDLFLR